MSYVHRAPIPHECNTPISGANVGDVWQCDTPACKKLWVRDRPRNGHGGPRWYPKTS